MEKAERILLIRETELPFTPLKRQLELCVLYQLLSETQTSGRSSSLPKKGIFLRRREHQGPIVVQG